MGAWLPSGPGVNHLKSLRLCRRPATQCGCLRSPVHARTGREIDVKLTSFGPPAELRQSGEARQKGRHGVELGGRRLLFVRACVTAMLALIAAGVLPARAVEAINVRTDA